MAKQSTRVCQPDVEESNDAFSLLCEWLETETEPYSLNELHEKMMLPKISTHSSDWKLDERRDIKTMSIFLGVNEKVTLF